MMQNAGLSVGALLRSRREELGQDTETVSRQLRIRSIYLRAIEEGRIQDLPGATYAVGFVRSYADFLGFDGNSVVANFRDELGQRSRSETVSWQIDDRDGGFPFGKILVVLLVIAAAGYGLWYYLANTQSGSGLIEAVPEYLKKNTGTDKPASSATGSAPGSNTGSATGEASAGGQAPAPAGQSGGAAPAAAGSAADGQASTGATTPAAGQNAPADNAAAATAPGATQPTSGDQEAENKANGQVSTAAPATAPAGNQPAVAGTAPATPPATAPSSAAPAGTAAATGQANTTQPATEQPATAPAAAQAATGTEAAPEVAAAASSPTTRVSIHAKLESWVQITDKDGKPVLSRVLRAGETYAVPDEKGLTMNTGNAGGIDLLVDGKALPSLGSVGLVKRNIVLDADRLATGSVTTEVPGKKPGSGDAPPAAAPAGD